jgi:NTP pyrophosphatase (non-canonical NTP hydrolase)
MTFPTIVESNVASTEEIRKLYARCVSLWGIHAQEDMVKEECAELITAISHFQRGRVDQEKVLGEIIDVLFTVGELVYIHGFEQHEMKHAMDYKISRTIERAEKSEKRLAEQTKFKGELNEQSEKAGNRSI